MDQNANPGSLCGTKKRRVGTSEFIGKFQCKTDFIKYFGEQRKLLLLSLIISIVQLYLPPATMMNKDFLRDVLSDQKQLMEIHYVRFVNVPLYDELSVMNLWPQL